MDKETLSNYGWIVICTLVLAVMIALATPFGEYIKAGVESTVNGLYDVNNKAMDIVCKENVVSKENETFIPGATFTDGTFLSWEELKSLYPINDTTVSEDAFYNCGHISRVDYTGTIDDWVQIGFYNSRANPIYYAEENIRIPGSA